MEMNEHEKRSDEQLPSEAVHQEPVNPQDVLESLPAEEIQETAVDMEKKQQSADSCAPEMSPVEKVPEHAPEKTEPIVNPSCSDPGQREPVAEKKKKAKKQRRNPLKGVVIGLSTALVLTVAGGMAAVVAVQHHYSNQITLMHQSMDEKIGNLETKLQNHSDTVIGAAPAAENGLTPNQVYVKNVQAVVSVECEYKTEDEEGEGAWATGGGSGFTITEDGYILTNSHVIADASSVAVRFSDGEVLNAEVVGNDPANDVALLKVEWSQLPVVELGSSDALTVGDQVVVIGYPLFTTKPVLTAGYVSAKDQVISPEGSGSLNTIQIDAAINSGNSGGPVFNALGQVIGIAVAKESGLSSTGATIEGVGFTVPIDDALRILPDLYEFGYVKSGFLGVMVRDVDLNAQSYGLPAGAFVAEATYGYAAYQAGVQEQDIIIGVDGTDVASTADLTRMLQKYKAGEEITLTVWRKGEIVYLKAVLEERIETKSGESKQPEGENGTQEEWFDDFLRPFFDGNS